MFFLLFALTLIGAPSQAQALDRCPALAGQYVSQACPKPETTFSTTMVHVVDCRAIGFQRINYRADGVPISWGAVAWEPIGLGKIIRGETDKVVSLIERFYDSDSLYGYLYEFDKVTKQTDYRGTEIIDLLPNGNLFVTYPSSGMSQAMIRYETCLKN